MVKPRIPSAQTIMDFVVLWLMMVAVVKFVPLPSQLKMWLVPKAA